MSIVASGIGDHGEIYIIMERAREVIVAERITGRRENFWLGEIATKYANITSIPLT